MNEEIAPDRNANVRRLAGLGCEEQQITDLELVPLDDGAGPELIRYRSR